MKNYHELFTFARQSLKNAHAPYSNFRVGAAIEDENGQIFGGCNVENISYPCGSCAETGAIATMVCHGGTRIRRILITSDGDSLITPCGACLQRILEFSTDTTEILLADKKEVRKIYNIKELLPNAFKDF